MIDIILSSALSAVLASGIIFALFRKFLFDRLDRQQLLAQKEIEYQSESRNAFISSRMGIYPELNEIAYKFRGFAQSCKKHGNMPMPEIQKFNELTAQFVTKLTTFKLFIPEDVWTELHVVKNTAQYLYLHLDIANGSDELNMVAKSSDISEIIRSDAERLLLDVQNLENRIKDDVSKLTRLNKSTWR